jgi:hypothetical protein
VPRPLPYKGLHLDVICRSRAAGNAETGMCCRFGAARHLGKSLPYICGFRVLVYLTSGQFMENRACQSLNSPTRII